MRSQIPQCKIVWEYYPGGGVGSQAGGMRTLAPVSAALRISGAYPLALARMSCMHGCFGGELMGGCDVLGLPG